MVRPRRGGEGVYDLRYVCMTEPLREGVNKKILLFFSGRGGHVPLLVEFFYALPKDENEK